MEEVRMFSSRREPQQRRIICFCCQQEGHTERRCPENSSPWKTSSYPGLRKFSLHERLERLIGVLAVLVGRMPVRCRRRKLLCYNCRKEGHIAKSCPSSKLVRPCKVSLSSSPPLVGVTSSVELPTRAVVEVAPRLQSHNVSPPLERKSHPR